MKALAKKSTANQSKEYDLERHITMLFSICCLPNLWNFFTENSTLKQFKVIRDHQSWYQSKVNMQHSISHCYIYSEHQHVLLHVGNIY